MDQVNLQQKDRTPFCDSRNVAMPTNKMAQVHLLWA